MREKTLEDTIIFTVQKATFDESTTARLIELSRIWADENITFGLRANTKEDLKEPCFTAVSEGEIIGYAFGHYYEREHPNSVIKKGSRCFELDELYVLPRFRSEGVGAALFRAIEKEARQNADFMTLTTATKDWRRILSFYSDGMEMVFHDAYLVKALEE